VLVPAPWPSVLVSARAPQVRRFAAQGHVCAVPGHLCLVAVVALVVEPSCERLRGEWPVGEAEGAGAGTGGTEIERGSAGGEF